MSPDARSPHALFPGTFDPITLGHLDVLARALRMFSRVTIAVADHPDKRQAFSLEERLGLIEEVTRGMVGLQVVALEGLVVHGCVDLGCDVIVRGVRSASDLEYERQMALTNRAMLPNVETVFLLPSPEHQSISSSLVRQIAEMGGDVSSFVPPAVHAALSKRFES
jgi:pantetheine-phosphate adenylyltransferase